MPGNLWQPPASSNLQQIYEWAQRVSRLLQEGRHRDFHFVSVTLAAGTSTVVADTKIGTSDRILVMPTNAAARALPVHVSARAAGASFTLTHGAAAGTETYDAVVIR